MFFPPIPWKNNKFGNASLSLVNSAHKNHMIHIWIGKYHLLDDSWQIFCFGQPKTSKFINFLLRNSNNNQFTVLYFRLEEGNKNWEKKGWIEKTQKKIMTSYDWTTYIFLFSDHTLTIGCVFLEVLERKRGMASALDGF